MTQVAWPLGPPLRARRKAAELSQVAAARLANISPSKWRQLENGFTKTRSGLQETGTTPETVAKAARAVSWDIAEALAVAGFDPRDHQHLIDELQRSVIVNEPTEGDVLPGLSELPSATRQALRDLVASLTSQGSASELGSATLSYGTLPSDAAQRGHPVAYSDEQSSTQTGE